MSDKNGLEPARGLDPWRWPNGSQPLGTRMVFLLTQATHFETVMTTVDEVSDKTKVADEFILRGVLLDCFTAELDE